MVVAVVVMEVLAGIVVIVVLVRTPTEFYVFT